MASKIKKLRILNSTIGLTGCCLFIPAYIAAKIIPMKEGPQVLDQYPIAAAIMTYCGGAALILMVIAITRQWVFGVKD